MDLESLRKETAKGLCANPEQYAGLIEHMRKISKDPDTINAQMLAEDFEAQNIRLRVNPHFSNAGLIENMCDGGIYYYLKSWSIIHNSTTTPFITSDNPICSIEYPDSDNPTIMHTNMYVPLTPRLAILIHIPCMPDPALNESIIWDLFPKTEGIEKLNSTIIKFADNLVIANIEADWIKSMVDKFKDHQEHFCEQVVMTGTDEGGNYQIIQKRFNV